MNSDMVKSEKFGRPHLVCHFTVPLSEFQKQPREVFYKKRCSQKFHKIHRKTPVPKSLF